MVPFFEAFAFWWPHGAVRNEPLKTLIRVCIACVLEGDGYWRGGSKLAPRGTPLRRSSSPLSVRDAGRLFFVA